MRFRLPTAAAPPGFQITPMVDIFCCLLIFFIVTYNFSREETALEVKVPTAKEGKEVRRDIRELIINVKSDGGIILNRQTLTPDQLRTKLAQISEIYPDQAVILRGDESVNYRYIVDVLDICRSANVWNVAFATSKVPPAQP
jgi:biopolymer transport protein ExbD